jgi:hypothetical protein
MAQHSTFKQAFIVTKFLSKQWSKHAALSAPQYIANSAPFNCANKLTNNWAECKSN